MFSRLQVQSRILFRIHFCFGAGATAASVAVGHRPSSHAQQVSDVCVMCVCVCVFTLCEFASVYRLRWVSTRVA